MFMVYSKKIRDFPGGPVVKSPPANAEDSGSIPGRGAKIPHAWQPKDQNIKRSNIVANSIYCLDNCGFVVEPEVR